MKEIKKGFYAYPSYPPVALVIQPAIQQINSAGYAIRVKDWQTMSISGNFILDEICDEIDDSDVFLCDLTRINMNVLFELGYAIAQNKRIWISINEDLHDKEKLYEELGLLTTIGYRNFRNAGDLAGAFLRDEPFNDLQNTIYNKKFKPYVRYNKAPKLLYLRSAISTPESNSLTLLVSKSGIPLIDDDPLETRSRPLEEYIDSLSNSIGVIAHFVDETQDSKNAKYAFLCGIAYGGSIKPLMLAHAPYTPAIDYRDLIFIHDNPSQCVEHAKTWLFDVKSHYDRSEKRYRDFKKRKEAVQTLEKINLGEYEAEGEKDQLENYFIKTAAFNEALNTSQYMIYVGRKGSGKTANFYQIAQELNNHDRQNQVCVIKPIHYELEGVYEIFNLSQSKAETGNLIESLWKYLIYTELAFDYYKNLHLKPRVTLTEQEEDLVKYIEHHDFLQSDFTVRMEHAIRNLCEIEFENTITQQRKKVSEILHDTIISQLRILLGNTLSAKKKVFILIDNLDKAWQKRDDLDTLSEFLFGLLKVGERITIEFQQSDSRRRKVELAILVFVRGDIFSYIATKAREPDKLKSVYINWNDPQLLLRVIEERFRSSLTGTESSDEIWQTYFTETVQGISAKQYIIRNTLPKPRDIIFFCKQAMYHAINHGHSRIEEQDIIQAEQDYSFHTWRTLLAETETQFPGINELLELFTKEPEIITRGRIEEFMKEIGISLKKTNDIIQLLCEASFLGLECDLNDFVFVYDDRLKQRRTQARKVAKQTGEERYRINIPFHAYLDIKRVP